MRLLYGTGNAAKLEAMRRRLAELDLEILGLEDMDKEAPYVPENGRTPLENARQKAFAYYEAFGIPVFSCDSGLYFQGVPEEVQPGVHVRTVGGKYLTDEEMLEYYGGLARKYGDLRARQRFLIPGSGTAVFPWTAFLWMWRRGNIFMIWRRRRWTRRQWRTVS